MPYKVRLFHVNPDFSVEPPPKKPWAVELERDEDLVFLLNRVAVVASQFKLPDLPELEITVRDKRASVTVVEGLLYYSEAHSTNRRNLKVVPEEVISLLADQSLEEVFRGTSVLDRVFPVRDHRKQRVRAVLSFTALLVMCAIIVLCVLRLWFVLAHEPSLVEELRFSPCRICEQDTLRNFSDVYVSEYREGGLVFQITESGEVGFYEMWHSEARKGFVLVPTGVYRVEVGRHGGEVALLAGDIHLMMPEGRESMSLHGVLYQRQYGQLKDLGEVLELDRL